MIRNLDTKPPKKHNWTRDIILVLLAIALVVGIFNASNRFNFDTGKMRMDRTSSDLVYFAGDLVPEKLGLDKVAMQPVYDVAAKNKRHFKQVEIHLERQDSYGTLSDATELRFYIILRFNDGQEMTSLYTRTNRKGLARKIAWRMNEDMGKYFELIKKNRGKNIEGVTNTL